MNNPYAQWAAFANYQNAAAAAMAQNKQWAYPVPSPSTPQPFQATPYAPSFVQPRVPLYPIAPTYPSGQYLQPSLYPGIANTPAGYQYPGRSISAPTTPILPQQQAAARPSRSFQDHTVDNLTGNFGRLEVGEQPSHFPVGGNLQYTETEPLYHSFRLTALPPGNKSFRLVEFSPVPTPHSPISCKLRTFTLQDHPEYVALSYAVSVSKISRRFRRLEQIRCNDGYIEVYGGMLDILYTILDRFDPVYLWIDCFCISPLDPAEKAQQISMMKHIYRKAKETVIWLGHPNDNPQMVGTAFDALKIGHTHYSDVKTRQALQSKWQSTSAVVNALALSQLLSKSYFSRTWMLQEAALSSHAVIYCGTYRIKWSDFCEQLACLTHIGYLDMLMASMPNPLTLYNGHVWVARHMAFITLWRELEQQRRQRIPATEPLPLKLKYLMRLTRGMNASDLRDRVYALLGLCSDGHEIRVDTNPNYTVATLYHQLAMYFTMPRDAGIRDWNRSFFKDIQEKDRLYLKNLPSWVPVWEFRPLRTLWTEAHTAKYKAGGQTKPVIWRDSDFTLPRHLYVEGVITTQILHITTPCPTFVDKPEYAQLSQPSKIVGRVKSTGRWFLEAFNLIQRCVPAYHTRTEDFCRTLCANSSHMEGDELPLEAPRVPITNPRELVRFWKDYMAMYQFAESHQFCSDVYTVAQSGALKNRDEGAQMWQEITTFCVPDSSFFLTENGMMGLGPGLAQKGDKVCVFTGAPTPTVLRPTNGDAGRQYQVVGHAYVHGLMDGEAFQLSPGGNDLIRLV